MNNNHAASSALSSEDRKLVRRIGTRLRQILSGENSELEDVDRLDELGILANLVNRVANELHASRQRDQQQREELQQRLAEQEALYQTQQQLLATIEALSAPVLNMHSGVLLVPIVGVVDDDRAAQLITALLESTSKHHAHTVILDITGVAALDTAVANALLQAAQALKLLGARIILCGIAPEVAQVIVGLGIDMSALTTCSDLQAALRRAIPASDVHPAQAR